jgi:hypothetical protein
LTQDLAYRNRIAGAIRIGAGDIVGRTAANPPLRRQERNRPAEQGVRRIVLERDRDVGIGSGGRVGDFEFGGRRE